MNSPLVGEMLYKRAFTSVATKRSKMVIKNWRLHVAVIRFDYWHFHNAFIWIGPEFIHRIFFCSKVLFVYLFCFLILIESKWNFHYPSDPRVILSCHKCTSLWWTYWNQFQKFSQRTYTFPKRFYLRTQWLWVTAKKKVFENKRLIFSRPVRRADCRLLGNLHQSSISHNWCWCLHQRNGTYATETSMFWS